MPTDTIETIDREALAQVSGARSSGSDEQLTMMLNQITSSIKDLASSRNESDPTQMLLLMMMMGGMGGGGGGGGVIAPAAAPAAGPPVINVDTSVLNRGGGGGGPFCAPMPRPCGSKKGW